MRPDDTPEMRIMQELLPNDMLIRAWAQNVLVGLDFDGWVMVRKSALHKLCQSAGVDYDEFDPTDGGRAAG
jgi:hypothetical protein